MPVDLKKTIGYQEYSGRRAKVASLRVLFSLRRFEKYLFLLLFFLLSACLLAQDDVKPRTALENARTQRDLLWNFPLMNDGDTIRQKSLFAIGLRPESNRLPYHSNRLARPSQNFDLNSKGGLSLFLSYEMFVIKSRLSLRLDNTTRLFRINEVDYDYNLSFLIRNPQTSTNLLQGARYDANYSALDITVKYYLDSFLDKYLNRKSTDKNLFGYYVFARVKDAVRYSRRTTIRVEEPFQYLTFKGGESVLTVDPYFVMLGLGVSQRLFHRLFLEANFSRGWAINSSIARTLELGVDHHISEIRLGFGWFFGGVF